MNRQEIDRIFDENIFDFMLWDDGTTYLLMKKPDACSYRDSCIDDDFFFSVGVNNCWVQPRGNKSIDEWRDFISKNKIKVRFSNLLKIINSLQRDLDFHRDMYEKLTKGITKC